MTDVALQWLDAHADAVIGAGDLLADDGLATAIILSLACDRRADDNDVLPAGDTDRRGWWGDAFSPVQGDHIGSKLWLLWRAPRNTETLERAKQYSKQALQWMIDDGVASSVECTAYWQTVASLTQSDVQPDLYALVFELKVIKPNGGIESFRFAYQWAVELARTN